MRIDHFLTWAEKSQHETEGVIILSLRLTEVAAELIEEIFIGFEVAGAPDAVVGGLFETTKIAVEFLE